MTMNIITFPVNNTIPEKFRIKSPIEQNQYLIDGEIREWAGPKQDVLSPICEMAGGTIQQKRIGSFPQLSEEEALKALDAARKAYNYGRGPWPTMSVERAHQEH